MDEQGRDAYQVLGTSWESIYDPKLNWDEASRNRDLKERYDRKKKNAQALIKEPTATEETKEKKRKEIIDCEWAYPLVATEDLRTVYNQEIAEKRERQKKQAQKRGELRSVNDKFRILREKVKKSRESQKEIEDKTVKQKSRFEKFREQYRYKEGRQKNPYRYLKILPDDKRIASCSKKEKKEILQKLRDEQLKLFYQQLREYNDITEKYRAIVVIHEIKQAYEQIILEEQLKDEKNGEKEELKYSHISEYNPELIKTTNIKDEMLFQNKLIIKKAETSKECSYEDKQNRSLRVTKTATIAFFDSDRNLQRIYEYKLKRNIGGEEKIDTVYTDVLIVPQDSEKREEENFDIQEEDFIINELFSEKMIRFSKYNKGYIGSIEKSEEGKYNLTLGNKKLTKREQGILTTVVMLNQKEKKEKKENGKER